MSALSQYRSYLERAYDRHGYGAIRTVGLWWILALLPLVFVDVNTELGFAAFWIVVGLILAGLVGTVWHLWGMSIRRSNTKAQKLEDEEWERFNG